jgi:hypothetical protein
MEKEIAIACEQGIKELEAILAYTQALGQTQIEDMRTIYLDNRRDELPHIQNIVVALTAMLRGQQPDAAARMDSIKEFTNTTT